jgi:hypothetical protein
MTAFPEFVNLADKQRPLACGEKSRPHSTGGGLGLAQSCTDVRSSTVRPER